jgi:hypothetical protein
LIIIFFIIKEETIIFADQSEYKQEQLSQQPKYINDKTVMLLSYRGFEGNFNKVTFCQNNDKIIFTYSICDENGKVKQYPCPEYDRTINYIDEYNKNEKLAKITTYNPDGTKKTNIKNTHLNESFFILNNLN